MNRPGNSGAISMALILNILLILSIGAAVYYLTSQLKQSATQVQNPPPPAPASAPVATTPPAPPAPTEPQAAVEEEDIEALKQVLEQEQSRLNELREEEELIESYLREAESDPVSDSAPGSLITPMGFPERPPEQ